MIVYDVNGRPVGSTSGKATFRSDNPMRRKHHQMANGTYGATQVKKYTKMVQDILSSHINTSNIRPWKKTKI